MTGLAHGGGAPEAAMIGLPLVLFTVFVLLERRARRRQGSPPERDTQSGAEQADPGHTAP